MAEFVQLRKEKWTGALDALKKLHLFSDDDLRSLVRQIDHFEYKVQSPNRTLSDVLSCIEFECKLLRRIQQIRKELNQHEHNDEIDRFIYLEILSQFGSAELNFKHEIDFWYAKLQFVANIVPEPDRENELSNTFKKALNYCGKGSFDLYKEAVKYQWSLLDQPKPVFKKKKMKKKMQPRDCSRIMKSIREITGDAIRNYRGRSEVYLWDEIRIQHYINVISDSILMTFQVISSELRYLSVLKGKTEAQMGENCKNKESFDIQEETAKTEKVIQLYYSEFLGTFVKEIHPLFQLYDVCSSFHDIPLTKELQNQIRREVLSIQLNEPKSLEVFEWIVNQCDCLEDDSVRASLKAITQALSTISTNAMLDFCISKLKNVLQQVSASNHLTTLSEVVQLCVELYTSKKFETFPSETFHVCRIQFLKQIPDYIKLLEMSSDRKTIKSLGSVLEAFPLQDTAVNSLEKLPTSFALVKEVVLLIICTGEKITNTDAGRVLRYLLGVNWKDEKKQDKILQFLKIVYYSFATSSLKVKERLTSLFNMSMIPGMDELLINHLKKLYIEGINKGRSFYKQFRLSTSSWRLACAVIGIETDYCSATGQYSDVLKTAIEDSIRLCESSTIEPWKIAILSHCRMKNQKSAKELMSRALSFSIEKGNTEMHKDLLLFCKQNVK